MPQTNVIRTSRGRTKASVLCKTPLVIPGCNVGHKPLFWGICRKCLKSFEHLREISNICLYRWNLSLLQYILTGGDKWGGTSTNICSWREFESFFRVFNCYYRSSVECCSMNAVKYTRTDLPTVCTTSAHLWKPPTSILHLVCFRIIYEIYQSSAFAVFSRATNRSPVSWNRESCFKPLTA